jgi:alkylhydroperoxidase family enzyme
MARIAGVDRPGMSLAAVVFAAVKRKLGRVPRPLRIHAVHPAILRGYALMESAQEGASTVPRGLKKLAQTRVATRIGCPF